MDQKIWKNPIKGIKWTVFLTLEQLNSYILITDLLIGSHRFNPIRSSYWFSFKIAQKWNFQYFFFSSKRRISRKKKESHDNHKPRYKITVFVIFSLQILYIEEFFAEFLTHFFVCSLYSWLVYFISILNLNQYRFFKKWSGPRLARGIGSILTSVVLSFLTHANCISFISIFAEKRKGLSLVPTPERIK